MTMNPFISMVLAASILTFVGSSWAQSEFKPSDEPRPMALRQLEMGRTFGAETSGTVNPSPRVPQPVIITKAEWGGGESSGTMRTHTPTFLTFHHEGTNKALAADHDFAKALQGLQKYGWEQKGWADIPYHYLVDVNGKIYEARDVTKVGDTNTKYDPSGHVLFCVMGNYELQTANEAQLKALVDLMAWISDKYNIDPATLRGHLEYASTACPGKYLYPYVASGFFEGEIRKALRKAYLGGK
ncbi:hypothetical protein CVU37_03925 [candidate division BRC1 bacterium HGW-BRC1-1]|jgi:hypothetical protein|nr:MAG: hypothetical protein CVU37_03925 [candidate division BRC1 bacterium HGW-BRC1-1]